MSKAYLSLAEAAEYLGVNERTIRNYIAQGRLPAWRMGPRLVKIKVDDLERCLVRIPTV